MLHRLGNNITFLLSIFIEFENKMIHQIKPIIPGSLDIFSKYKKTLKESCWWSNYCKALSWHFLMSATRLWTLCVIYVVTTLRSNKLKAIFLSIKAHLTSIVYLTGHSTKIEFRIWLGSFVNHAFSLIKNVTTSCNLLSKETIKEMKLLVPLSQHERKGDIDVGMRVFMHVT